MKVQKILTEKQDAMLRTCRTILKRCLEFAIAMGLIPRFGELAQEMTILIEKINAAIAAKQTSRSTKEVTKQKNDNLANLMSSLDELGSLAVGIADHKKNTDWLAKAEKALKKNTKNDSEEGVLLVASEFSKFLRTIDAKTLAHFGVDEAEIKDIDTQVENIHDWRVRKDLATDQKVLDNKVVSDLFDQLETLKGQMDTLSVRFKTKSPDFFAVYDKAKNINQKAGAKQGRVRKEAKPKDGDATTTPDKTTTVTTKNDTTPSDNTSIAKKVK